MRDHKKAMWIKKKKEKRRLPSFVDSGKLLVNL